MAPEGAFTTWIGEVMAANTGNSERTIGQLVVDATDDIKKIVRGEVALAKAELTTGAKGIGKGAGMLGAAGFVALLGLIYLLHAAAWGIGEVLPLWAGYLIVAAVLFVLAAILGLLGKKALSAAKPKPERTIRNAQETVATLKSSGTES